MANGTTLESKPPLFKNTVTIGNLMTITVIVVGLIVSYVTSQVELSYLKEEQEVQRETISKIVDELGSQQQVTAGELAQIEALRERIRLDEQYMSRGRSARWIQI